MSKYSETENWNRNVRTIAELFTDKAFYKWYKKKYWSK